MPAKKSQFNPDNAGPDISTRTRALTLAIRSLRVGDLVELPNGTMVRSITVTQGAHQKRRFAVIPAGTAAERHRAVHLGAGHCKTAENAARRALGVLPDAD